MNNILISAIDNIAISVEHQAKVIEQDWTKAYELGDIINKAMETMKFLETKADDIIRRNDEGIKTVAEFIKLTDENIILMEKFMMEQ